MTAARSRSTATIPTTTRCPPTENAAGETPRPAASAPRKPGDTPYLRHNPRRRTRERPRKAHRQYADTLTRAITALRAVGDIGSAEAEVYAARTSADQCVATAEARLAEVIQRRRDAESERDTARADREQADDATSQAITRMDDRERELADLRASSGADEPDAAGRAETGEMRKACCQHAPPVCRGQRGQRRRAKTAETYVVWLITQRS